MAPLFKTDIGPVGMLFCSDTMSPEAAIAVALTRARRALDKYPEGGLVTTPEQIAEVCRKVNEHRRPALRGETPHYAWEWDAPAGQES